MTTDTDPWAGPAQGLTEPPPVPFGEAPNQVMPWEWAVWMLQDWFGRDPAGFGAKLAEAATGHAPKVRRQR